MLKRFLVTLAALLGLVAGLAVAATPASAATPTAQRTAQLIAIYDHVVPARERAVLANRYTIGYSIPGISCGTGCTRYVPSANHVWSSFNATFFRESPARQRNTVAHEAAHAYGFLKFKRYAQASWQSVGGWQTQFHNVDRSFVRTYDAEAFADCVAWKESGFNDLVDNVRRVCTAAGASLAMAQIR